MGTENREGTMRRARGAAAARQRRRTARPPELRWRACAALAFAFALGPAVPRAAAENPGTTAAPILQFPIGARAFGMGSAFTGVASDVSSIYYNPAGLSTIDYRELSFMYLKGFEDQKLEHIAAVTPLPLAGLIEQGYASLAASALFSQNGTIEYNRLAPDGTLQSSESLDAGSDFVGTLAYAERIGNYEFRTRRDKEITVQHYAGVSGKYIASSLANGQYKAKAYAGDFGYLVKSPETGLSVGASLLNLGSKMKFLEEGDPLPMTARLGAAQRVELPDVLSMPANHALLFAADGVYLVHEEQWHVDFGMEYSAWRHYALRLGYRFHQDLVGLTFGFGAVWRQFGIDYAWGMTSALSDTHRFSLTWRFGRVSQPKREMKRKPFIESMPEREDLLDIEERRPEYLTPPQRPKAAPSEERRRAPGWIY
ncbi:MAG: hypothetical protein A2X36_01700 [Elusimicrobia bacterium GWA2_69_24]|nr:MAG: hypothetical protein A2X36_01700 [Elusimicrobia bacterium GWA2_69_24]HBL19125.1 hypothetical protein [Elusimicrobiota bacterium]